jgi:Putative Ig domain
VTVQAIDSRNRSGSSTFTWNVVPAMSNPGNRKARVGRKIKLQITANDNNSGPLRYSASGLPPGLSIKSTTGLITGRPYAAGTYSVTASARVGAVSGNVRFRWTITGPYVSRASLTGIARGAPKLVFTLNAGPGSPAMKKVQISLPSGLSFPNGFGLAGGTLARGTTVSSSNGKRINGYALSVSKGRLTITLPSSVRTVRVTVTRPAIRANSGLTRRVKQKKVQRLGVALRPTDANRFTALVNLTLKPS